VRLRRRRFLQLAAASALPRRARAAGGDPPGAYEVHRATRNTWHGPTALGSLFSEQPLPYKPYPEAERIALPAGAPVSRLSLADATRADAARLLGEPIPLALLARLLALANGVTGTVGGSDPPVQRRAAPSAGALYAGEVYVVAERVDGLAPGVFYYAALEHALVPLRSGAQLAAVTSAVEEPEALAGAACVVLLTNVFARYAWRYGARGYRYALVDSGHIGENLRLAAAAAGLGHRGVPRFADDALAALLGVDGREEAVCALHAVGRAASASPAPHERALAEQGAADPSGSDVERYHEATKLVPAPAGVPAPAASAAPTEPAPTLVLAPPAAPELPLARAIEQRRSARGFREEPIAQDALAFALREARTPGLALRLAVHRVDGVAAGVWDAAGPGGLALVRGGSVERALVRACLFQGRAGSAAVAFAWAAELRAGGERAYRDRLLEAGAAAERLYLAAESLGLAARNLAAFFDDSLNDLLALDGRTRAVVHLTLLGLESS
jgi:SagB-type dehydrogenase family enzyme